MSKETASSKETKDTTIQTFIRDLGDPNAMLGTPAHADRLKPLEAINYTLIGENTYQLERSGQHCVVVIPSQLEVIEDMERLRSNDLAAPKISVNGEEKLWKFALSKVLFGLTAPSIKAAALRSSRGVDDSMRELAWEGLEQ